MMVKDKDINFEDKLWKAADKLRKKVEVHNYKYVVLGLIFLRYLSFAFNERRKELEKIAEKKGAWILEDRDYYISEGVLYVPEKARWDYIKKNANQPNIGEILDNAVEIWRRSIPSNSRMLFPSYTQR